MRTYVDIALYVLLAIDISLGVTNMFRCSFTKDDKRIMRKACKLYEDVGREMGPISKYPEQLSDDLRALDKLKHKIRN